MSNLCRRCNITNLEPKKRICKRCQNNQLRIKTINHKYNNIIINKLTEDNNKLQQTNEQLIEENIKLKELLLLLIKKPI